MTFLYRGKMHNRTSLSDTILFGMLAPNPICLILHIPIIYCTPFYSSTFLRFYHNIPKETMTLGSLGP